MEKNIYHFDEEDLASTPVILAHLSPPAQEFSSPDAIIAPCPSCGYIRGNVVRMPAGCVHYAALKCGRCDRWLRWLPKPENKARKQKTQKGGGC